MAASSEQKSEYVCTLSDELIQKAEQELNEKPQWRSRDIQALRDMLEKRPDLQIQKDDAFLLRFLRAKKFDYDRAFNLIVRHFEMKAEDKNKQLFTNLRPSAVKHVLEAGVTGVLPHRDKLGRRVIVFRPGKWDPSQYSIDDVFKTNFLTLSKLIQDEATQVSGVVMMMDLNDIGWNHARNIGPFYAKRVMSLLQDCFPMRFKGVHYLNEPVIFDGIFAIVRPFMKEKILQRLHFHGKNYKELQDYIDVEHLPSDYGGKGPPYSNKEWAKTLLDCDTEFDAEAKYGLVKSSGITKSSSNVADDCLSGTFKKLDI